MGLINVLKKAFSGTRYEDLPFAERDCNDISDVFYDDKRWAPRGSDVEKLIYNMFDMNRISLEIGSPNFYTTIDEKEVEGHRSSKGDWSYSTQCIAELYWNTQIRRKTYTYTYISYQPRNSSNGDVIRRGKIRKGNSTLTYEIHTKDSYKKNWWEYSNNGNTFRYQGGDFRDLSGSFVNILNPWD